MVLLLLAIVSAMPTARCEIPRGPLASWNLGGKMDIDTAPCQLWSHGAKPSHLIGAHQDMADPRSVFQGLQMIKLVGKGPTASSFGEMVRFIDDDGVRMMLNQGFFHRLSQITDPDGWRFTTHKGVVDLPQHRCVVVYPVEAA